MAYKIGIRREDRNVFERRTPITPEHVNDLADADIDVVVQSSWIRIHSDEEFEQAGAEVREDISDVPVVFGVKEMPVPFFQKDGVYVFFSHTIKGQRHNMPMLRRMMDLGCTLIDYEKITNESGKRLIFFGRHAGIAGMVETLWALGKRMEALGHKTPFRRIGRPYEYKSLKEVKDAVAELGNELETKGIPKPLQPLVFGFGGYGNVSKGAQEIFDLLPHINISPMELESRNGRLDKDSIYKVVFYERDMVDPVGTRKFDLKDYYAHPEKYKGHFDQYLPHLSVFVNCIYWDERYPRLITKDDLGAIWKRDRGDIHLKVIGDISCDINGSIEMTEKATDPANPVFVYDPRTRKVEDGFSGDGVVVMAVDALPSELPWDASQEFSQMLIDYVPIIAKADFDQPFDRLSLPDELKRAIVLHKGKLTRDYEYLKEFVKQP